MNDRLHRDVYSQLSPASFNFRSFFTLPFLLSLCLAVLSLHVGAEPQSAGSTPRGIDVDQASHATTSPETTDLERTHQPAADECGLHAGDQAESANTLQTTDLIENIYKNTDVQPFDCLISARQVHDGWSKQQIQLIDVRRSQEFEKFQIPGSMNLATFSIKTKPYLKDKQIVLVNEGRYLTQLERTCDQLKSLGFNRVKVMSGGIFAWQQAGFPVAGDKLALSRLNIMAPSEWISTLNERNWTYIDLDGSLLSLANHLPGSSVIEYQGAKKRKFLSEVNQASKSSSSKMLSGFLVISSKGDDYKSAERLLQLTDAKNIFYLSGGVVEFKRYLNTHSSLISRLTRGFKEPHRCSG